MYLYVALPALTVEMYCVWSIEEGQAFGRTPHPHVGNGAGLVTAAIADEIVEDVGANDVVVRALEAAPAELVAVGGSDFPLSRSVQRIIDQSPVK